MRQINAGAIALANVKAVPTPANELVRKFVAGIAYHMEERVFWPNNGLMPTTTGRKPALDQTARAVVAAMACR